LLARDVVQGKSNARVLGRKLLYGSRQYILDGGLSGRDRQAAMFDIVSPGFEVFIQRREPFDKRLSQLIQNFPLKGQLDLRLLAALAARHGQWSFVFVGPLASLGDAGTWVEHLSRMPNVHFLGEKEVGELPAYTQHLDVCTMCYVMNDYTKFIYPLKLHEYLAAGRPVVATPIRSLQEFRGVIELATTEEEWSRALEQSLSVEAQSPAQALGRQDVARGYDWNDLVQKIAYTMCDGLGPAYCDRLQEASLHRHRAMPR